jgi:hypothetical protein
MRREESDGVLLLRNSAGQGAIMAVSAVGRSIVALSQWNCSQVLSREKKGTRRASELPAPRADKGVWERVRKEGR